MLFVDSSRELVQGILVNMPRIRSMAKEPSFTQMALNTKVSKDKLTN